MLVAANPSSGGGLGFLVFAAFVVTAIVIFIAMNRSMRRMRSHVDRGDFGRSDALGGDELGSAGGTPQRDGKADPTV